jgi:hypothetical protein
LVCYGIGENGQLALTTKNERSNLIERELEDLAAKGFICFDHINQEGQKIYVSPCTVSSHVPAFVQDRLWRPPGLSLGATDLRDAYVAWCTKHDYIPLSPQKLATELAAMGFTKWNGRMRYRDLQLVA